MTNFGNCGGGSANAYQVMPLVPGQVDATSGADDIDTTGMSLLYLADDCTIYMESESTKTLSVLAPAVFNVIACDSVHVDGIVHYAYV